ncbi:MAG: hypothetical protein R2911_03805 [Caldilineaceae bacterium]
MAVVLALGLGLLFGVSSLALAITDLTLPLWQDAPSTIVGPSAQCGWSVAGAVVRVQATENMVVTSEDGTFTLIGLQPAELVTITTSARSLH